MSLSTRSAAVSPRQGLARFWLPLEATWLMMAAEGPFLAAVIARLAAPKENLAAYGVATSLAWIVEAPIVMMLSASNALCRDGAAYRKLRRFSFALNGLVTAAMAVLITPPVFKLIARHVLGLPSDISALAGGSMIFLVLWPGAIGYRRFYQGILIRDGRPHAVTWGTVIRLVTMAATGLFLALVLRLPGASVGAGAVGVGVVAEGAASRFMARHSVRALKRQRDEDCPFGRALTLSSIRKFYVPLALTSFLSFFINPLTTFFLARGRHPIESLAVLPVVLGLVFIFRTAGIALQEVVIACLDDEGRTKGRLATFTLRVGLISTAGLAVVVLTPVARLWYHSVSGLSLELAAFAVLPGCLLVLVPLLEAVLSYQRGVMVKTRRTGPVGIAVGAQLGATIAAFAAGLAFVPVPGVLLVGPALTLGYFAGNAALLFLRRLVSAV
ncbi:MAG: hypothetical protein PHI34_07955 [Acidobacteriota bacterium]|nr:hypothetical protein [Acidobacteriota bacterium]